MHSAVAVSVSISRENGDARAVVTTTTAAGQESVRTLPRIASVRDKDVLAEAYKEASSTLATFRGEEDLFRGTPLSCVMRRFSWILAHSGGSAHTYQLSRPVTALRTFISHNWAVGRFRKYIALCIHFNLAIAIASAIAMSLGLCLLHILGVILCYDDRVLGSDLAPAPSGWAVRVVVPFVFFFVFFFARDATTIFGVKGPRVFLDKICIHQTDITVQRKGILRLGAFLNYSDEMLVLYTNMYLLKLWTIFEVAAFLVLSPRHKMKVVPVNLAVLYVVALFFTCSGPVNVVICRMYDLRDWLGVALAITFNVIYIYVLRDWHRDKLLMRERIEAFSVKNALCAVESDRALVCQNIITFMKAYERVPVDATDADALDAFDDMVRKTLPDAFEKSFGKHLSFTYRQVLFRGFLSSVTMAIDALGGLGSSNSTVQTRQLVAGFCSYLQWGIMITPILMAGQEYLASFKLDWSGWKNILVVILVTAATACFSAPMLELFDVIRELGEDSNIGLAFLIACTAWSATAGSLLITGLFA